MVGREAAAAAGRAVAVREMEKAVVVREAEETGGRTGGWGGRSAESGGRRVEDGEDEGAGRGMRGGRGERGERGGWRHTTARACTLWRGGLRGRFNGPSPGLKPGLNHRVEGRSDQKGPPDGKVRRTDGREGERGKG